MSRISDVIGLVVVSAALGACMDDRAFPEPAEMCERLVQVCGDRVIWEIDERLRACYEVGRAGAADSRQEDQCYAVFDQCFEECDYYSYWYGYAGDAGYDASSDAGHPEHPLRDAESPSGSSSTDAGAFSDAALQVAADAGTGPTADAAETTEGDAAR